MQLLAPAVLSLALGAMLLACSAPDRGLRARSAEGPMGAPAEGGAVSSEAAALLRDVVAPAVGLLGACVCVCWPVGVALGAFAFSSPAA